MTDTVPRTVRDAHDRQAAHGRANDNQPADQQ